MVSLLWYSSVFAAQDRFPLPQENAFRKQGLTQRGCFFRGVGTESRMLEPNVGSRERGRGEYERGSNPRIFCK